MLQRMSCKTSVKYKMLQRMYYRTIVGPLWVVSAVCRGLSVKWFAIAGLLIDGRAGNVPPPYWTAHYMEGPLCKATPQ